MTATLTENTQAILLLTAPLIVGRERQDADLLTPGEYNRLARLLRQKQKQPADLLGADAYQLINACASIAPHERLRALLDRGFQLSQAVEHWSARAIWVVSRADADYPRRLRSLLKEDAPAVLYGCGDSRLFDTRGFAVVGSRHVDTELITYTEGIGKLVSESNCTLVSGGAKGIDVASMHGALRSGGKAIGVVADSLERSALSHPAREWISDGKLVLVSPFDPAAGFNVGNAMQRNKVIYALAEAALVVSADLEKGGTWSGAVEQLDRFRLGPVFVRNGANAPKGNTALLRRGARAWPDAKTSEDFLCALQNATAAVAAEPKQETLEFSLKEQATSCVPAPAVTPKVETPAALAADTPMEELFVTVRMILRRELTRPRSEKEIAELLDVPKPVAKRWLGKLVESGEIECLKKPVRYRVAQPNNQLL